MTEFAFAMGLPGLVPRKRQRFSHSCDGVAISLEQGDVGLEGLAQAAHDDSCFRRVGIRRQQCGQHGIAPPAPAALVLVVAEMHEHAACQRQDDEARQQGEIDLQEKAVTHDPPTHRHPACAQRRNPSRAR